MQDLVLLLYAATPVVGAGLVVGVVRRHRRRASILLLVAGNVLALLALAGTAMTIGELYYRFVYDRSDAMHASLVSRRWIERHYRYNNFHVRDDVDYALRIAPGRTRITVLGDSFANGHGVADVRRRFVNLLRAARADREVHLLAQDGMDTGPIIEDLREKLSVGYELDCVLYAYGLNDVVDLIPEWEPVARRVYEASPGFFVANSFLVNTLYYRYQIASDPDLGRYLDLISARYEDPAWESQARRLSSLAALVRDAGGKLVVVSFPFLQALDSPRFAAIHERLSGFWAGIGVPDLDLLEIYREHAREDLTVNPYDPHPNELAHRLAAEALEPFLERACAR